MKIISVLGHSVSSFHIFSVFLFVLFMLHILIQHFDGGKKAISSEIAWLSLSLWQEASIGVNHFVFVWCSMVLAMVCSFLLFFFSLTCKFGYCDVKIAMIHCASKAPAFPPIFIYSLFSLLYNLDWHQCWLNCLHHALSV